MLELAKVYIFGYSGHSYVVIESLIALGYHIAGYFDKREADKNPYQLPYLGDETKARLNDIIGTAFVFPTIGDNSIREKIVELFNSHGLRQMTVIDPSALVSSSAIVGSSTYIGKGAIVNALAYIGKGCIINSGATVEHECYIDDYVHIAPSVVLCGNVIVGRNVLIGANAVVKQGISIHTNTTIGAGSVVLKDIFTATRWAGNPAKQI